MSTRALGLLWALVASPIIGWMAASVADSATHGRVGVSGAIFFMAIVPAGLASAGNAVLRRGLGAVARAGISAAAVCYLGFLLYVLVFFLTVPPEFFQ